MYPVEMYVSGAAGLHGGGDECSGSLPGVRPAPGPRCARCWPTRCRPATGARVRHGDPTLRQAQEEAFTGVIDAILEGNSRVPRKQRHTAKRVFERSRTSTGSTAGRVAGAQR